VPGAQKVLDQVSSGFKNAKGASWVMEYSISRNQIAFEELVTQGRKFSADIVEEMPNNLRKYSEC
jgi:hypothetical protein